MNRTAGASSWAARSGVRVEVAEIAKSDSMGRKLKDAKGPKKDARLWWKPERIKG